MTATQYFWENKIHGNQTTNQLLIANYSPIISPFRFHLPFCKGFPNHNWLEAAPATGQQGSGPSAFAESQRGFWGTAHGLHPHGMPGATEALKFHGFFWRWKQRFWGVRKKKKVHTHKFVSCPFYAMNWCKLGYALTPFQPLWCFKSEAMTARVSRSGPWFHRSRSFARKKLEKVPLFKSSTLFFGASNLHTSIPSIPSIPTPITIHTSIHHSPIPPDTSGCVQEIAWSFKNGRIPLKVRICQCQKMDGIYKDL